MSNTNIDNDNESSNQRELRGKNRDHHPNFVNSPKEKVLDFKEELRRKLAMGSSKPKVSNNEEEKGGLDYKNLFVNGISEDGKEEVNNDEYIMSPLNENYKNFEEFEKKFQQKSKSFWDELDSVNKNNIDTVEQIVNNFQSEDGEHEVANSFESIRMSNKELDFDPQEVQSHSEIEKENDDDDIGNDFE
eukprot:CAMPEP_0205808254 /NCGR_PEP_ID=MMETSP0205-20121125/12146_1 /ASSEMBLY_ACC=CAM_ASM_000278 /TAXON_ID=36767 /ORGANISM="Euplotes focardii, Strain TN1" /LENGTH=188 /DNA_ID=CAMNT_0053083625 /DNA_START=256 /DNA_END=819 /DNA_ORIENTATION=-